jgi:hypothetical protein
MILHSSTHIVPVHGNVGAHLARLPAAFIAVPGLDPGIDPAIRLHAKKDGAAGEARG